MNLLTDIINDVAVEMQLELTKKEALDIQKSCLGSIVNRLSWIKQERIEADGMPWLEKPKVAA